MSFKQKSHVSSGIDGTIIGRHSCMNQNVEEMRSQSVRLWSPSIKVG